MLNEMLRPGAKTSTEQSSTDQPATRPAPPEVLQPVGKGAPGPGAGLLREGSDVIAQHGHLVKVPDAPYVQFVFDGPAGAAPAPMWVLPNLQLMSMEDACSAMKEDLDFTVAGTVTEYRGKNFILLKWRPDDNNGPGSDALGSDLPASNSGSDGPAADSPAKRGPAPADQMLKAMLTAEKPTGRMLPTAPVAQRDLTSGPGAVAPKAPSLNVLPEPSQIFDRVCRLSPTPDGSREQLTFESDGTSMDDPPLIVLPNLKLMDLEKAAGDHRTRVRVTGLITEYRGRNYILLQKVVVMADSDRQF
jgi:hypothetical protein